MCAFFLSVLDFFQLSAGQIYVYMIIHALEIGLMPKTCIPKHHHIYMPHQLSLVLFLLSFRFSLDCRCKHTDSLEIINMKIISLLCLDWFAMSGVSDRCRVGRKKVPHDKQTKKETKKLRRVRERHGTT